MDGERHADASVGAGAVISLLSYCVSTFAGLAITVLAVRTIGATEFGNWQLATTVGTYVAILANPALDRFGIRELGREKLSHLRRFTMQNIFSLQLLGVSSVALLAVALGYLLQQRYGLAPVIGMGIAGQTVRSMYPEWTAVSLNRIPTAALLMAAGPVGTLCAFLMLRSWLVASSVTLGAASLAGGAFAIILAIATMRHSVVPSRASLRSAGYRDIVAGARTLAAGRLFGLLAINFDYLVVYFLLSPTALTQYALCYKAVSVAQGVAVVAQNPLASWLGSMKTEERWSALTIVIALSAFLGLLLVGTVGGLGLLVIPTIFPTGSVPTTVFLVLLIGVAIQTVNAGVGTWLLMTPSASDLHRPQLAAAGCALIISPVAVSLSGLPGAAAATLVGSIASTMATFRLVKSCRGTRGPAYY